MLDVLKKHLIFHRFFEKFIQCILNIFSLPPYSSQIFVFFFLFFLKITYLVQFVYFIFFKQSPLLNLELTNLLATRVGQQFQGILGSLPLQC